MKFSLLESACALKFLLTKRQFCKAKNNDFGRSATITADFTT